MSTLKGRMMSRMKLKPTVYYIITTPTKIHIPRDLKELLGIKMSERNYTDEDCEQFVYDMKKAGLEVYHYNGRFFWEGPAVNVDNLQNALSSTKVACQWDQMGKGCVVYPLRQDKGEIINSDIKEIV